jgi:LmbE family N-acetylglucosaminyl deacetylase
MENKKKIAILAPHTDDGELGCGGSIAKFIEEGNEVFYIAFSTANDSVPEGLPKNILETEVKKATKVLGIKESNLVIYKFQVRKLNYVRQEILEEMVKFSKNINPDLVFLPTPNDLHQDHYTVAMEGIRAFKKTSIFAYELPWNNIQFNTQAFINLEKKHLELKIKALQEYKSQKNRDYMNESFVLALAQTRGIQIGTKYAETFD